MAKYRCKCKFLYKIQHITKYPIVGTIGVFEDLGQASTSLAREIWRVYSPHPPLSHALLFLLGANDFSAAMIISSIASDIARFFSSA